MEKIIDLFSFEDDTPIGLISLGLRKKSRPQEFAFVKNKFPKNIDITDILTSYNY